MQGRSVPADERERAVRDSTRAVRADRSLCRQIACALLTDEEPILEAFEGEPVLEVMAVFVWALDKETEEPERFDPSIALPAWARKRGRGAWRPPRGAQRTWTGNSAEEDQEIQEALEEGGSVAECYDCGAKRRIKHLWQVNPVEAEHSLEFSGGELLCVDCSGKHGLR